MNPGLKLLLVMAIALEISFTQSLIVNIILVVVSFGYILIQRVSLKALLGSFSGRCFPQLACLYHNGFTEVPGFTLLGSCLLGFTPMSF